ncbi:hypothetical protein HELRODRAFT_90918, partial [Helobdella robusta]|uniref:Proteasome subunit beta n=1 Tax=Helobdella robusta TaxID=6412 RepID=T1G7X9_HELRO
TTIIAMKYDSGIILAGDSRVTIEDDIINRFADKITKIRKNVFCCRSGAESDTHAIIQRATFHLSLLSLESNKEPPIKMAANLFHELCYKNRESLECGIICAGWDEVDGFQIYDIPFDGMCVAQPYAVAGSGSQYVSSYVDFHFNGENMSREKCMELSTNAVTLGIHRDGSSGGAVRIIDVTKDTHDSKILYHEQLLKFSSYAI